MTVIVVVILIMLLPLILYLSAKLATYGVYKGRQRFLEQESEKDGKDQTTA